MGIAVSFAWSAMSSVMTARVQWSFGVQSFSLWISGEGWVGEQMNRNERWLLFVREIAVLPVLDCPGDARDADDDAAAPAEVVAGEAAAL